MLGAGHILVQRYGDILDGKRTWAKELARANVRPTLKDAVAGDITSAMPYRAMVNIIEFIKMVDHVVPGFASPETLLYSPELKFYSNKVKMGHRPGDQHPGSALPGGFLRLDPRPDDGLRHGRAHGPQTHGKARILIFCTKNSGHPPAGCPLCCCFGEKIRLQQVAPPVTFFCSTASLSTGAVSSLFWT